MSPSSRSLPLVTFFVAVLMLSGCSLMSTQQDGGEGEVVYSAEESDYTDRLHDVTERFDSFGYIERTSRWKLDVAFAGTIPPAVRAVVNDAPDYLTVTVRTCRYSQAELEAAIERAIGHPAVISAGTHGDNDALEVGTQSPLLMLSPDPAEVLGIDVAVVVVWGELLQTVRGNLGTIRGARDLGSADG
ncbi:hypothetical protein [Mumia sp. Pv 4-285]|uniref:hypothetical protein n=1 Tax=Mumia qirimensis TaxID=3234852 RepID=UPI00351D7646